jgi:hypothetical protein
MSMDLKFKAMKYKISMPIQISKNETKLLYNHILIKIVRLDRNAYRFDGIGYFPQDEQDEIKHRILKKINNENKKKR